MSKPIYTEHQRYTQWWLHLLIILACFSAPVIFGIAIYNQVVNDIPFGDEPMSDTALIFFGSAISVFTVMIYIFFYYTHLEIKVYKDLFMFRFRPFMSQRAISTEEIKEWSVEDYKPIREYGGWGIRVSFKGRGWAYSVRGSSGLYIKRNDGKELMVGTQNPEKLRSAMLRMAPEKEKAS